MQAGVRNGDGHVKHWQEEDSHEQHSSIICVSAARRIICVMLLVA